MVFKERGVTYVLCIVLAKMMALGERIDIGYLQVCL
jgi:hypothetical protein